MRIAAPVLAALATLAPSIALACPYASRAAGDCAACGGSSVLGYGAAALLGLGIGVASVAFERRKS
jgi:hypothetical protein